jgi:hypothetical protein
LHCHPIAGRPAHLPLQPRPRRRVHTPQHTSRRLQRLGESTRSS